MIFKKLKSNLIDCKIFLQSSKSPHFPLRGKVGQFSERKRVLCWSIYTIVVCWLNIVRDQAGS